MGTQPVGVFILISADASVTDSAAKAAAPANVFKIRDFMTPPLA
jgi:hypothetical protein